MKLKKGKFYIHIYPASAIKYFTGFPYSYILDLTLFLCGLYRLSQLKHGSVNSCPVSQKESLTNTSDGNFILEYSGQKISDENLIL